jgi:hypothetical protein
VLLLTGVEKICDHGKTQVLRVANRFPGIGKRLPGHFMSLNFCCYQSRLFQWSVKDFQYLLTESCTLAIDE